MNSWGDEDRLLLPPGLYEHLVSHGIEELLKGIADPRLFAVGGLDPDDAHTAIAQYLEHLFCRRARAVSWFGRSPAPAATG